MRGGGQKSLKMCLRNVRMVPKPPLWPLLRDFGLLQTDDQCLEIFGRYLLPNTVTVGNQCLLFQDKDVFFS